MQEQVQIKINVEVSMRDALRSYAVEHDISVSAIVRRAVRMLFYAEAQGNNHPVLLGAKEATK